MWRSGELVPPQTRQSHDLERQDAFKRQQKRAGDEPFERGFGAWIAVAPALAVR